MTPEWPAGLVVYSLALWVLLSGLDDLFLQLVFFYLWITGDRGFRAPSRGELTQTRQKRIAVFVPLWHEHAVIRHMLEHNLSAVRYQACEFFVGVYPNDPATTAEVRRVERRFVNVHLAECPHDGPTSKADCLNWIYQRMLLWEEEHGLRFEAVVTHDAEDLIHPEALLMINWCLNRWDMVQVPVLPLPTPLSEWTHGFYCDEFAEFQTKDLPVRNRLGGFVPSTGVGAGFSREVLESLAGRHGNRVFEPESLTEDYESGFRVHALGRPQVFLPPHVFGTELLATREYFPRTFAGAVKQRTRWVTGISLQGWQRHGWRVPLKQVYWLWRDRKGLVGNLLTPLLNALFGWSIVAWLLGEPSSTRLWQLPGLTALGTFTMAGSCLQVAVRAACVRRIYGRRHALMVPFRAVFGNALNCLSTVSALWRFCAAKLRGQPLVWLKTEHTYPCRAVLKLHAGPAARRRAVPVRSAANGAGAAERKATAARSR